MTTVTITASNARPTKHHDDGGVTVGMDVDIVLAGAVDLPRGGEVTVYPDVINGGWSSCNSPRDGWVSGRLLDAVDGAASTMDVSLLLAEVETLAGYAAEGAAEGEVYSSEIDLALAEEASPAKALIALSISEDRIVSERPDSLDEARQLIEDLGALCDDDCSPRDHHSGAGYSGPEAAGYYDIWGTTDTGAEWRVHIISADVDAAD